MSISAILGSFSHQVKSRGLLSALHSFSRRAQVRYIEWRLGIYTETSIELSELGINNPECKHYGATDYSSIREIVKALEIDPHEHTFLDFGAGLGRAMILAAMHPFQRVLGVEISPELSDQARQNIAQCRRKLSCQHIEVSTCDATTYLIPADATVIYFNNPFFGKILTTVIANLWRSLEAAPRTVRVVCNLPTASAFESQIAEYDWLRLQKQFALSDGRRCLIYQATER